MSKLLSFDLALEVSNWQGLTSRLERTIKVASIATEISKAAQPERYAAYTPNGVALELDCN